MTPEDSLAAVRAAARKHHLDSTGAQLLQPGRNHTWRLPGSKVIAKARSGATFTEAYRETQAARYMMSHGIPAARPVGQERYPFRHDTGHETVYVLFTEDLGPSTIPATPHQVALLLRRLHALPVPIGPRLRLPAIDPFSRLFLGIDGLFPAGSARDRQRLHRLLHAAREAWQATAWPGPMAPLHGDVGQGNCIVTADGVAHLIDFERMSVGPVLGDLAAYGWRRDALGADPAEFEEFAAAYGLDVTGHADGRTYREALTPAFAVSAWLAAASYARDEPHWQHEADLRLTTLLADPLPGFPWHWNLGNAAVMKAAG
ncbi:phosphotransferase family protein [Kitasatospora sp. NPDC057542]|uniref:phosphotransferase family protein n=1 Tax=Kitasatospora sp. NPDC057542 TaxID=3346162 RepID=UPI00368F4584